MIFFDFIVLFLTFLMSFCVLSGCLYRLVKGDFFRYLFFVAGISLFLYFLKFGVYLDYWSFSLSVFLLVLFIGMFFYERRSFLMLKKR